VIEKLKGGPRHTGNEGSMKKNKRCFKRENEKTKTRRRIRRSKRE